MMTSKIERRVCPHALSGQLFWLCAVTYVIALFGRMSYSSVMVALIADGSMNKAQAGLIGTALFIVYGICQIFSGLIGDRISPKKMVFTGLMGSGMLNLLMGLTGQYTVMLVLWSCNGIFQSLLWSPVARIFAEQMPPDTRKQACSNVAVTYPLATVLTYLMATVMLSVWGWRSIFFLSAGIILSAGFYWLYRMTWFEQQIAQSTEVETISLHPQPQQKKDSLLHMMLVSGILLAAFASMTHGMLRDGIQTWLPSLMTDNFHFGTAASVALDIIVPLVNIFGVVITKAIAKRYIENELKGSAGFFAVTIVSLVLLGFACNRSAVVSLLLLTVASTCMVGVNILLVNLIPVHFGAIGRSSSVTGILNCSAYVGSALSSFGIGAIAEGFGWSSAIWIWVLFSLGAWMTAIAGTRRWGYYERRLDG
ncbi:MAG: MFS transporter [Eubacteriales bacterium]|nr:MFS transporter [Eubacteriales bacterium]